MTTSDPIRCFFIANNNISDKGLSGGCRIFVELARRWKDRMALSIVGSDDTIGVCRRERPEGRESEPGGHGSNGVASVHEWPPGCLEVVPRGTLPLVRGECIFAAIAGFAQGRSAGRLPAGPIHQP